MRISRPYKVTIGLSEGAWELLQENVVKGKASEFFDEMLIEVLQDKKFKLGMLNRKLEEANVLALKAGFRLEIVMHPVLTLQQEVQDKRAKK